MGWSWKLGSWRGISVYMHATFLLLLGFVLFEHLASGDPLAQALEGVAFTLALFTCVVLHEFGHALAAARFGIQTRDITLLPIGGVARLERMPEEPLQELWVAIAGPLVNVAIAAAIYLWLTAFGGLQSLERFSMATGPFLERLLAVNVALVLFNLLPAFPMDGGRVLRALLAARLQYTRATQIAATIGQAMALVFGFIGFFSNPFLLFIALFVWIGATQEASMVQMKAALGGIPVVQAMQTHFTALAPEEPLSRAIEETLAGTQQDFPVASAGRVVGILTRGDMLAGLTRLGRESRVADSMQREFITVDASDMLETAFARLQECACRTLPVLRHGELLGLVTMENLGEFLAIQSAVGNGWPKQSSLTPRLPLSGDAA